MPEAVSNAAGQSSSQDVMMRYATSMTRWKGQGL